LAKGYEFAVWVSTSESGASEIGEGISIFPILGGMPGLRLFGFFPGLSGSLRLLLGPNRMVIGFPNIAGDTLQPNQNLDLLLERQPGESFSVFGFSPENSTNDSSIQSGCP
jgi:hypothetical protein